ncbi:hypothetical protein SAMN05444000_103166 [Shimia gijangensis]|uniref:Outer membrane protein beta-barrel domain-containing protein n=1 Tax=Shimia gijangensis TaxID=1470563 RepID=A0A1M6EBH9_9RHOB|nr:hypothetical protein [Shimia gijangensis]SHI82832.1 hypothetical protein SAMN05444000_103166 [Shimia gijangensis]
MKRFLCTVAAAVSLLASTSHAQEVGNTALSLGLSSVGLTGQVAYRPNENWRLRGMISGAPTYRSGEEVAGISYDTKSSVRGVSLLADRTLWGSNFYLTFGAFISGTEAAGTATGTLQIGNNIYTTTLNAEAEFENAVSPIIGIGYDWEFNKNWFFTGTIGYIYTGGVNVSFNSTNPILPGDLVLERLQAEADIGDGYPFIELGLHYQF